MTFNNTRTAIYSAIVLVLFAGGFVAMIAWRQAQYPTIDVTKLWEWSIQSWDTTIVDADGNSIRIVQEPFAMFRNLSLIGLAFVGMMIFFIECASNGLASASNIDYVSKELDQNPSYSTLIQRAIDFNSLTGSFDDMSCRRKTII